MDAAVNIIPLLEVSNGTNDFHAKIAQKIAGEFSGFLKIHKVIDSNKYKISQVKFRKEGLPLFIKAVNDQNNEFGEVIRKTTGTESVDPTTAVSILGALLMARLNVINSQYKSKLHYGLRLRSNNQLGVYLTIGIQDLESFFERGKRIKEEMAAESVAHLVDAQAITEALGR